ncbi:MAG: hypothetical protein WAT39_12935 [Planctomycetota bacterium]
MFDVHRVQPIELTAFSRFVSGRTTSFRVRIRGRAHTAAAAHADVRWFDLSVRYDQGLRHFALVPGGVLPPDFVLRGGTRVLMDRNVVSDLRQMPAVDVGAPHQLRWLDVDGFHVNPILGVVEGSKRRPQTFGEFEREYTRAERLVARRLPRAKVVQFSGSKRRMMFDMHLEFAPRAAREGQFLRGIAGRLAEQVPDRDLRTTEQFVLQAAAQAGLQPMTAVVLTALAKLHEGRHGSPAAKLLKLRELRDAGGDWQGCAYNAVADVRQMELLSNGIAMPDFVAGLTGDLGLAQVWCGLRPTGVKLCDGRVGFYFRLDPALFPRLDGTTEDLIERINAGGTAAAGG